MARRSDTPEESEARMLRLRADLHSWSEAGLAKMREKAGLPPPSPPRPSLSAFAGENIEPLLQTIEAGPSDEQVRALAEVVPTLPGRTHVVFEYGKAARTRCKEYYAKKYPGVPLAEIAEIKGMTAFHNSLKDLLDRDFDSMLAVTKRLAAVHEAERKLNDLKASFNQLGSVTKPLGKLMSIDEMEDGLEQLEQDRIHMEARHTAEKAQLEDEIDTLEQAIATERG